MINKLIKKYGFHFRLLFSLAILLLLIFHPAINISHAFKILLDLDFKYLILFFLIKFVLIVFISLRLKLVLNNQNLIYKTTRLIKLYFLGIFYNQFLPTQYGGDIVKAIVLSKDCDKKSPIFYSVLVDRIIGLSSQIIIGFFATVFAFEFLIFLGDIRYIFLIFPLLIFGILFIVTTKSFNDIGLLILTKIRLYRLRDKLEDINNSIISIKKNKKNLALVFSISLLIQTGMYFNFFVLSTALQMSVDLKYFFIFLPAIAILTMIPLSINGVGIRESGLVFFLTKIGINSNIAFSFSILIFFTLLIDAIIGGIINLRRKI